MKKIVLFIMLIALIGCGQSRKEEPNLNQDTSETEEVVNEDTSKDEDSVDEDVEVEMTLEEEIQILIEKKEALIEEKKQAAKNLVGKEKSDKIQDINKEISKVSQDIGDLKRKLNK